ncbi:MAG: M1 family metallopeptidase [Bacteroidetes bacterium]|nr:M1 family metallopeptidase [Bacteroidota bacterium]
MKKLHFSILTFLFVCLAGHVSAQENTNISKFRQLKQELATPNVYRTASGAPGHEYWQQQADYNIKIVLDDETQRINGSETITYHNNSPDPLNYLWIQLDQNIRAKNSLRVKVNAVEMYERISPRSMSYLHYDFDGGFKIESVKNESGENLPYTINYTMMRIDLPETLQPGSNVILNIKWWYNINDRAKVFGRSGYEYFEENDNYLYTIAQFYPRMAVYNEVEGWQNKQFLGSGEFTLPFGNFDVSITVPDNHIVAATGILQNAGDILTGDQLDRIEKASNSDVPVMIVSEKEAIKNEKDKSSKTKTWKFHADNVRDFAFASSGKFIWDAMGVKFGDRTVMAMSFYPKEGNPLWEKYSTKVVAHTIKTYSKYTFDFPYPVAQSIHTDRIGMEYPMICFNGGRPEADGTYSERTKWGMIGVIIHEVGHNFFPMIVNSDERQWTWMDEGFNTFLQGVAEREWDHNHPSWSGNPADIVDYMKGDKSRITPIMSNAESLYQSGNNAYQKTSAGLNILRETIMGRELFDFAFKQYAQRWKFKHPTPADFFRTMEDASAVDLDWFWRGWFFTTDHVDISLDEVKIFTVNSMDPEIEKPYENKKKESEPEHISIIRNREAMKSAVEQDKTLVDFYDKYDLYKITNEDKEDYKSYLGSLSDEEKKYLSPEYQYYQLKFSNLGGMIMPVIVEFTFTDGTKKLERIPAEVWLRHEDQVTKVFPFHKKVTGITIDPYLETADADTGNNHWPPKPEISKFKLYKYNRRSPKNPMQKEDNK